ncbi:unnamed protein product [Miscanthus lutarioriparius]|uniref:Vacuolar ATP synthase subunit D n=1 Tax=Miscanthus lutarioriparius TaxID=422564 RepID=A0A811R7W2_9POAL|nr:unnamed protein product [Miscanthus lutarioriparius]
MAGLGQQRLNVVPTVTTLGMVKARLAGATRGHALLKKKSDALTVQFRAILKRIVSAKDAMGDAMRAASLSLAEALYVAAAPLRHVVQQSVSGPARLRVRAHQDNIAGVRLPRFKSYRRRHRRGRWLSVARGARRRRAAEDPGVQERELERQKEVATRYAEEKAAGEVALKRGVSVATAESMLENGDTDEDIIF